MGPLEILIITSIIGISQLIGSKWIENRMRSRMDLKNAEILEKMKWEERVRLQAERVAEYLALARDLSESDSPETYRRANQLSWELAIWLPEDLYNNMARAVVKPDEEINPLSVVSEVRRLLLGEKAGGLSPKKIAHHAVGIGKGLKSG